MNKNFLVVGTVSNVEKLLENDLTKIYNSLSPFGKVEIFLVESDSIDKTVLLMSELKIKLPNFSFLTLGKLSPSVPNRTDRIRYCRNHYVSYIRENFEKKSWDYVVVCDLDGMNSAINSRKIGAILDKSARWDACFATQTFGYYDLYALRAATWAEIDSFDELAAMKSLAPYEPRFNFPFLEFIHAFMHFDKLRRVAIYSKMRRLKGDLVFVDSAFGGMAIYKSEIFLKFDYTGVDGHQKFKCEHLDLHAKCISSGLRLAIDPKFINGHWNEYNLNRITVVRFLRELKKYALEKSNIK